ncbi:DUF1508 domain-containing protein [Nissabacter sp. SGAir0207]|uniref:YegP family protein n=1 Tax=Nissabacter sp. SGAir0207 TaxID=2126321 RepID=UPI0010CCEC4C|nr:DUF1508 domain-containing protein [Nissabacter sp. SGAir0207]QCR38559.1 hypothetical protein C1N62_20770 [Nissabacter sp. SGAir0207]
MHSIPYFYIYLCKNGEWRWRFMASDGGLIAVSPKGYKELAKCESKVHMLMAETAGAVTIGDTHYSPLSL